MFRNHRTFNDDINKLGDCVCDLLSYIVENESRKKQIRHLNQTMISILRAVSQAVWFIRSYADRIAPGSYALLCEVQPTDRFEQSDS